jgi:hypothetical protein
VIGQNRDYLVLLIGDGVADAVSKEGLYILSGPVPTVLNDLLLQTTVRM